MTNNTKQSKRNKRKISQYHPSRFFPLENLLLDHPDFLSMTWASQSLLIHMCGFYNGFNNGDISIPESIMKKRGFCKVTLHRAKKDLINRGWIIQTRQGYKRKCSLFALSWLPLDECKNKYDIEIGSYGLRNLRDISITYGTLTKVSHMQGKTFQKTAVIPYIGSKEMKH